MSPPPPEEFVARDRARRIAWRLEEILQAWRLAWRGDEIGMASLTDEADAAMAAVAEEARQSATAVLEGRLRDREHRRLEAPLVVALTTVARRLEVAAEAEALRRTGQRPEDAARREVRQELEAAQRRLEAFRAASDAQERPGPPPSVDLARLLTGVGRGEAVAPEGVRWPLHADPVALEDLLVAARAALPDAEAPWQILPPAPGRPLALVVGRGDGGRAVEEAPPEVARAVRLLERTCPVVVEARGEPTPEGSDRLCGLVVRLGDPAGDSLDATIASLAGPAARLSPAAREAVRALLAAPPLAPGSEASRLVPLLGVLQVLDREVEAAVRPRLADAALRVAAGELPREPSRRAPVRRALAAALAAEHPGLPVDKLGGLASRVAAGRVRDGDLAPAGVALLLAAFGRARAVGGTRLERHLDLDPLADADVAALVRDLLDVAIVRRTLEAGRGAPPTSITRLECAAIGVLGRLGRLGTRA